MRVSAAGNMPLQGLVKPPAKPVVMIIHSLSVVVENKKISKTRLTNALSYGMLYHVKAIAH